VALAPVAGGGTVSISARATEDLIRRTSGVPCEVTPASSRPVTRPRVSVIVLCYNYGRFLPSAVDSVLSQDAVDTEVIIVDDASPDGSGAVAESLARRDERVHALVLRRNVGPVRAFNGALGHVTGDFLVRLDADDLLTPGALARATALFERHPEVGLVYGTPRRFSEAVPRGARLEATSWTVWRGRDWLELRCRRGVNCLTSPEAVIRADLQRELGGQAEELGHTHDMEMWLRASTRADIGRVNGADAAYVRVHGASRTATLYTTHYQDLAERLRAFELALADPAHADLLAQARRSIARESVDRARHAYERSLTSKVPVQSYLDLARAACPEITTTSDWRALQRRERWGPDKAPYVPWHFVAAARRSLSNKAAYRAWKQTGL
jgi:glycosyltransferase involved in cell wall biosynthesis